MERLITQFDLQINWLTMLKLYSWRHMKCKVKKNVNVMRCLMQVSFAGACLHDEVVTWCNNSKWRQLFNVTTKEERVRTIVTPDCRMPHTVLVRQLNLTSSTEPEVTHTYTQLESETVVHVYLFFAEVYANDVTKRTNEFREDETINSWATSKFDDFTSGKFVRRHKSTTEIPYMKKFSK